MDLNPRKLRILRAIVDEYILSGAPVGSKVLSQNPSFKLSSATIRNEMADLEDLGYLEQPHTSAGRVPSDKAYRLYVNNMMQRSNLTEDEFKVMSAYCQSRVKGLDAVMRETANVLSRVTHYTALVMMPESTASASTRSTSPGSVISSSSSAISSHVEEAFGSWKESVGFVI